MSIHFTIKATITQNWFSCSTDCKLKTIHFLLSTYLEIPAIYFDGSFKKNISLKVT